MENLERDIILGARTL